MRVLLDEDVKKRLRHRLEGSTVEIETVGYRGFKGLSNGELLSAAVEAGFDVLLTLDTNLPHQRNLRGYDLGVVVVRPRDQSMQALAELVPEIEQALRDVERGSVVVVTDAALEK